MMTKPTKRLYITRELKEDSAFFELEKYGIQTIGKSLVSFKDVAFQVKSQYDWIFFYSQRAIIYFFKQEKYSQNISYGVMGSSSSDLFRSLTRNAPDFVGAGDASYIAKALTNKIKPARILFVKAQNSLNSIELKINEPSINSESLVVYANEKVVDFEIEACDILVFTSPLNADAYFEKYRYRNERLFAIGKTTADHLTKKWNLRALYPENPTESDLFLLIKSENGL
jgi:uroporphyrinogen-III synthase